MDHEPITPWSELEHILFDESAEPKALPLSFLEHITNGFSDDNEIGYGGFARVYKGMLDNGTVVAVKKLFNTFDIDEKKFIEEVCCLMKAKQKNIVRFLGYCSNTQGEILQFEGKPVLAEVRQRALCFEYLPKGSLDKQITDASCGLEWSKRYQIITGICDGLYYLHQKRILHLDLKPENILLDDNMIPKIADFGLSRCFDEKQSRAITSKPIGTLGYLPPEFYGGHITFKLDIYSLGIIITEMLTGEKGYPNIANVLERWRNRLEKTQGDTQLVQVRVCTEIAIQCTDSDPLKRPDTQHIIDRIGATKSVDESAAETGPSSSSSVAQSTEVAVLPRDELWPFLLRFPISAFEMCLGVSSQAMLWKTLESEPSMAFLRVCPAANHVLWWASIALTAVVSIVYLLKVIFYFEAVRREFHHPVRVNFFFAPWVACLFLVKGVPRLEWEIHHVFWYLLMAPILCLDLKIYGQWMSSGERRLSKVANPSNHLAVVGNFVGALLGAMMGLRDLPIFFFAIGLAHYAVLFVTLYQRLPTNVQLPKELHPVFFLFVATPSVASMAWARISGEFNNGAKLLYFVSLFLYVSLVVRVNLFRGLRFSLAWWAYTFPMTSVALATVLYALEENNMLTQTLAVGLSGIAVVTVIGVLATTVYHAFVCGDLFPNDVSIAITRKRPKFSNMFAHLRSPTPASSSPSSTSQFHFQARHLH